ncbi:restriction endonuclease subunit S [Pseudoalteromonas distincta]|uniref:restriction endonuclease subunit S n=1 Tax=Pseudoalteromonas distincta TaxID=77608 RepID=UPI00165F0334|nr:restriction endonuclease subunit S [Pseudoalteromonas distincta]MBD0411048.1 restriction endonuclease subunit S [Pseudoalteromonas distincta]
MIADLSDWSDFKCSQLFDQISTNTKKVKTKECKEVGKYPVVDQGASALAGYVDDETKLIELESPVCIFGDHTRAIKWIDFDFVPGADGTKVLQPKEFLNPRFFYYLLKSVYIEDKGYARHFKLLKDADVKVPSLDEQKLIADKLDSVLGKVEAAKARLDKIPTILKCFRQSVLAVATSGELTRDWREENESIQSAFEAYELKRLSDRKKWEEIKLSEFREKNKFPSNDKWKAKYKEVALPNQEELQPLNSGWGYFYVENVASSAKYSMSSGPFGSALGRKDYTEAGVPVLRGQNVKNGVAGVGGFVFVSEEKATSIPRSLAYPGDVVVVAVGSSGVTGIIPQNISVALLSQNCNKISVDNVLVRSEYFNLFLQSQVAQSQISAQTTDTVRQFFSLTNLKKTVIAVPPLQEQNEILLRVEELFEHANTVEKQYNAAKARLDKLIQSILAKAFRGELVTS